MGSGVRTKILIVNAVMVSFCMGDLALEEFWCEGYEE